MVAREILEKFRGKNVLITGGLGFIGSNLAIALAKVDANITILDAMIKGHGGNQFNIEPIRDKVLVKIGDVRDQATMEDMVTGKDFIFHLAGQNDHVISLTDPFPDIDINIKGSAMLLFCCKNRNPETRLVYTGTRGEYGAVKQLPVTEEAPINPRGIYELSSLTAQQLFKIYHDNHGVRSVTLRLTNIYGERAQMNHDRFGVVNWFIRLALDNQSIKVFGDGLLLRDFLYVQDAVDAIIMAAASEKAYGELFNLGGDTPLNFKELAGAIVKTTGSGNWEYAPFSAERAKLEPGDFYSDISKINRIVGWKPAYNIMQGLANTIDYYKKYREQYW
jgi:UDP-glucose 4-epimerase